MTTLLTIRDTIKAFCSRYDHILEPIGRFLLACVVFFSLRNQMGYMTALNNTWILLALAVLCAALPVEVIVGLAGVMIVLHSVKVSIDVGLAALALVLIFYCGYMRFFSKIGLVAVLVPVCFALHIQFALPIVLGVTVGTASIIPMAFGVLLYYYESGLSDLTKVLAAVTEEDNAIQGYQYVMSELLENHTMLMLMVVFAIVILLTYAIHRMSFAYSWLVAFLVGGFLNITLFLIGSITRGIEVEIASVLIGSLLGIVLALLIQFVRGMVDYQRTEILQFEDDEYYYYVKAIPKLAVAESNKNVKHINSKTQK